MFGLCVHGVGPQARTKEQQVKFATDRNYTQQADGMYIFGNDQVKDLSYGTTTVKLALVSCQTGLGTGFLTS